MIDLKLIKELEGWSDKPYVPNFGGRVIGFSGITIGNGMDLGQQSKYDLLQAGLDESDVAILEPFLGKRGMPALFLVKDAEKVINKELVRRVCEKFVDFRINMFEKIYESYKPLVVFGHLSDDVKTVLFSLYHVYGNKFFRVHNTFKQVLDCTTNEEVRCVLIKNLTNYGDKALDKRHKREATYLTEKKGMNSASTSSSASSEKAV